MCQVLYNDIIAAWPHSACDGYAGGRTRADLCFVTLLQDAHHSMIDDCEIMVDYNRQQLMPGWIPRRLGQLKILSSEILSLP